MGVEARFQAIPEDCELVQRARQDREVAEWMQFFNSFAHRGWRQPETPDERLFVESARELLQARPGLAERYVYNPTRMWDMIIYLLSPARREGEQQKDESLIRKAIWGSERLHPEAVAVQGFPIGFVPTREVRVIVDYLNTVTLQQFQEHYDPVRMREKAVYKIRGDEDSVLDGIPPDFEDMRWLYQQAAAYDEAVITVID